MKNIYVFSMKGIVYAIDEDGQKNMSSVTFGFTWKPKDLQEKLLIGSFKRFTEELKNNYIVINVINEDTKEGLIQAIKKLIVYTKINFSNGDDESWEEDLAHIKEDSFDIYNKNIWQIINSESA